MNISIDNKLRWRFAEVTIMEQHTFLKPLKMEMILININSDTTLMILTILLTLKNDLV